MTTVAIPPELKDFGVIRREGGGALDPAKGDLALTGGWGHAGREGATMPGKGKLAMLEATVDPPVPAYLLRLRTYRVYLNDRAYWDCVPEQAWDFTIGGYQLIKKWLSYRERALLDRDLTIEEAEHVTNMVRRIAAIVLLAEELDENYRECKDAAYTWPKA